jgi:hypothetical protein
MRATKPRRDEHLDRALPNADLIKREKVGRASVERVKAAVGAKQPAAN